MTVSQAPRNIIRVAGAAKATDVALTVRETSRGNLIKALTIPKAGEKDGSYIIRGGDLIAPRRADENLRTADLIIVDGDSRFDPETGEVLQGSVPIDDVANVMREMGVFFVIHTTHSADVPNGFWKWRLYLIASREYMRDELDAIVAWLFDQFYAREVWINNVSENTRWSQPWFMPRCATAALPHFRCEYADLDAPDLDVDAIVAQYRERVAKEQKLQQAIEQPRLRAIDADHAHDHGLIAAFNKAQDISSVRSMLERAGYRFMYTDARAMNGRGGYRYMRPNSESKTAGVVVFQGKDDPLVFSHHGNACPLSGRTSDPFDTYTLLFHNGDKSAAARALAKDYAPKEPSIVEQIRSRQIDGEAAPVTEDSLKHDHFLACDASYPQENAKTAKKIDLVPWSDLQDVKVQWLLKDIIPAQSLVALYGKPGSYKSFVALDLAARIAAGLPAFNRDTEQGAVIYIAGEGGAGLKRRRDAIVKRHGLPKDIPIYFLRAQLDLRSKADDAVALLAAIKALGVKVALIIIDTLARAFGGGNENSSEDMGAFIGVVGLVMEELQCAALIVHHSGKDEARGMRGHSSLLGAVDAELEVAKLSPDQSEERIGQLTVTKQKDGEDGFKITYRLETVALSPIDPEATSLAVVMMEEDEVSARQQKAAKPKKVTFADTAFGVLQEIMPKHGFMSDQEDHPIGVKIIHEDKWRDAFKLRSPADAPTFKGRWRDVQAKLMEQQKVDYFEPYYWLK